MSEAGIDMERCMQGVDDEAAWIPKITWTNCADKMPPDDEVIITECCNAQILRDQRYCPKCGYECRIHPRKMEGVK